MLTSLCSITSPAAIGSASGRAGSWRATYFSPNRVLGMIRAVTFAGMVSIESGKRPSVSVAPSRVASVASTSPTWTPRIFTSARAPSCRPILEDRSATSSYSVNFLLKMAYVSQPKSSRRARKATPNARCSSATASLKPLD